MIEKKQFTSTRLLLAGTVSLLLFAIIALLVFSKASQIFDANLALAIYNSNLGVPITQLMVLSSRYGREYFWIGIVALMLLFGKRDTKIFAIELATLFLVGIFVGELLKIVALRPRPFTTIPEIVARTSEVADSSFPSGHALIVSIGAFFVLTKLRGSKSKSIVAMLLTLEAAIVSYSRIYLGLHYPLDVIGAVCLGSTIVFFGVFILERYFGMLIQKIGILAEKVLGALRAPQVL